MRMWMLPTIILCRNHLLGEHNELHKLIGSIIKNKNLKGFIDNKFICLNQIQKRHEDLVKEFQRRNYNHQSPLFHNDEIYERNIGRKEIIFNLKDLINRCDGCKKRFVKLMKMRKEK